MKITKWSDIPDGFKILIRRQYREYRELVGIENAEPWIDWAARQGYDVSGK